NAGVLNAQQANALGTTAAGTVVNTGATLQLQNGNSTAAEPLAVSGTGAAGTSGALQNVGGGSGSNTLAGAVALLGDTTVGVDAGQLTVSGAVGGAASITKAGIGTLTLSGNSSYAGTTTVSTGILEAGGNNVSSLGAVTGNVVVADGSTLQFN